MKWTIHSGYGPVLGATSRLPFLSGVFPFRLTDDQFQLSLLSLIVSFLSFLVLSALGLLLATNPSAFYSTSDLVHLLYCAELLAVRASHFLAIFWPVLQLSSLRLFTSLLSKVDLFLATNGIFLRYRVSYREEMLFLGLILALATNHLARSPFDAWIVMRIYAYYFPMFALLQVSGQFRRWVSFLSLGFRGLSSCLSASPDLLEKTLLHFDYLYAAARLFDHLFGPQTLAIIFTSFLIITAGLFFPYLSYCLGGSFLECAGKGGWAVAFLIIAYNIIVPCTIIANDAKDFNALLYQLMIDDTTHDFSNNKKLKLHIAMKREIVFTACGFFNLDYTLVHSMIAAATTYLIILIQFGQPSPDLVPTSSPASTTIAFGNVTTMATFSSTTP